MGAEVDAHDRAAEALTRMSRIEAKIQEARRAYDAASETVRHFEAIRVGCEEQIHGLSHQFHQATVAFSAAIRAAQLEHEQGPKP